MIISVEQKHIKKGKRMSCGNCPIALAIKEQTYLESLSVGAEDVRSVWRSIPLSRSAQRFVQAFDKRKPVKPFKFKLNLEPA